MSDIQNKIQSIQSLEQIASNTTVIHRLHPMVKLISALLYIVVVVSFDRYAFGQLIPYVFYPVILMAISEIPYSVLLKRVALALPFCLFAGVSNIIFDQETMIIILGIPLSGGLVSLFTILFRTYLCVMAVLILVSTTSISELSDQLRRIHIPEIFVTIFEMTYRYIGTLLVEVSAMYTAYMLRANSKKGIEMQHMGFFVGFLLLKSFDRAERVYNAMKCRGYALSHSLRTKKKISKADVFFVSIVCIFCLLFRLINVQSLITQWIERLMV